MIVVDASALAAFILKEEGWRDLASYLVYCISLEHIVKEVTNAIWKASHLRGIITIQEAKKALELLKRMINKNIFLLPELNYLDLAFDISMKHGLTIYDSLYIALAISERKPLLTLDDEQRKVAERLGLELKP